MGISGRLTRQSDSLTLAEFAISRPCVEIQGEKLQKQREKDCLAVDGVCREPLSGPNSLLTGKFTGNFAKLAY